MNVDQIVGLVFVIGCILYYLPYGIRIIMDAWKDAFKK